MSATAFQRLRREKAAKLAEEEAKKQNEVDPELEELREKAKELKIRSYHNMKKETLLEKIAEAEQEKELNELREKAGSLGFENVEDKDQDTLLAEISEKENDEGTGEGQQSGNENK